MDPRIDPSLLDTVAEEDEARLEELTLLMIDRMYTEDPDGWLDRLGELTAAQRAVYVLDSAWSQIFNGGVWQCLVNSTGEFLDDFPALARQVGAHEHAALFDELRDLVGEPLPRDMEERQTVLDRIGDERDDAELEAELKRLDSAFYELQSAPERTLGVLVWRFVEARRDEFLLPRGLALAREDQLIAALADRAVEARALHGTADAAAVDAAERELGIELPPLVRRLYTEVADGGWGPGLGLIGLSDGGRAEEPLSLVEWLGQSPEPLPLFHWGEGEWTVLKRGREVRRSDEGRRDPQSVAERAQHWDGALLVTWLERWVTGRAAPGALA